MQIPRQTLLESLWQNAMQAPEWVAFISEGGKVTYAEFIGRVAAAQTRLLQAGLTKGERVLIVGSNHDAFAVAYFAVHSLGAIAVPIGSNTKTPELKFMIEDSMPALALVEERRNLGVEQLDLADMSAATENHATPKTGPGLDDAADILYTTGTTSRKKGVLLTHRNIAAAALNISSFIGNDRNDVEIVPIPLTHSFGLGRLRSLALVGNTLILEPGLRNPAILLKRLLDFKATGLALVPAGFELMLRLTRDKLAEAKDHLRYIEIGSAALREETQQQLMQLLPKTRICHHYGMTEASRACFRELHTDAHHSDSVGKPSPNVRIRIIDQQGMPVESGVAGEIVIEGAMTMKSYWRRPDLDADIFCQYGLRSGDLGKIDRDGYVYLLGRKKDIINVGGLKVAPTEIEEVALNEIPIRDCACVGIPDQITGEKIKLFYVADERLDDHYLVERFRTTLEEFKIPKVFQRIDSIPRTESGKILRHRLKEL